MLLYDHSHHFSCSRDKPLDRSGNIHCRYEARPQSKQPISLNKTLLLLLLLLLVLLLVLLQAAASDYLKTHCQVALLVCASKDGVLVQVLPLQFSVMQMQMLVIIYYTAPLLLPSLYALYSSCVDQISTPYILEMALETLSEFLL